jgi:hypothetical protein
MEFLAVLQALRPQKAVQALVAVVVAVLVQMEQQQVQVEMESQVAVGESGLLLEASTELRAQVVQVLLVAVVVLLVEILEVVLAEQVETASTF